MVPSDELQYRCLEPGCGSVIPAADDEQLIARVSEHMSEAHGTFEMEEVILANASVTDREPRTT